MRRDIAIAAQAIAYLEAHLWEAPDLETTAEALHYSPYYLHRRFRAAAGVTFRTYAHRRRLTEAARLLVFTGMPILDIALLAGYESQQAFSQGFKALYKKTPGRFRTEGDFYPLQLPWVLRPAAEKPERARFARTMDIPAWMELARLTVDGFPHLYEEEYVPRLRRAIRCRRALILRAGDAAAGALAFTPETGSIDFLAVHPLYWDSGADRALLQKALGLMEGPVSITTFRAGDRADTGSRRMVRALGFQEAELLTEFGYPTQRFYLRRRDHE